ncbi:related to Protoplast secreted protein 2 [Hanseniaspora guilliermondii]|uniref:Related to Protoplast secreted protein 2 n=1 Tax=Hanseniaspora guilliermondii TaxID=56406 RepID=A0A1L0FFD2_9ASCO|nr:related to Protoplast secreted protein 2 [Hanseniaspora guilliermondii]
MTIKIAIIIYSMYGHIATLAETEKKGILSSVPDAEVTIFQVAETLSPEVLEKMGAPPKKDYPIATPDTLVEHDAFLFGFNTRFGNITAQMKTFLDRTGGLWASGKLYGKMVGFFESSGSGTNAVTIINNLSYFVHHGCIFVPLGYAPAFAELTDLSVVKGGTAWGAGTIAGPQGELQPNELESKIAHIQGAEFAKTVKKHFS